jgi:tetratricopeptide (TPR) repeat protein
MSTVSTRPAVAMATIIPEVRLTEGEAAALAAERYAAGRLPGAENLCRRLLESQPDAIASLHLLGRICLDTGRPHEAAELLKRAIAATPGDSSLRRDLGRALAGLGRPAEAVTHFEAALLADPSDAEGARLLGLALADLGRLDAGVAALQDALLLRPDFAEAACDLGKVLQQAGRLAESELSLRRALGLTPDSPDAHAALARTLSALGRPDEAADAYHTALKLAPQDADIWLAFADLSQAESQYEDAVEAYQRALRLRPDWPAALSHLALAMLALGTPAEAEDLSRRAVALDKTNMQLLLNLAAVLMAERRAGEAVDCYRQVLQLDPASLPARIELARALQAMGEGAAAIEAAETAAALAPASAEAVAGLAGILTQEGHYAAAEAALRRHPAVSAYGPLAALGDALRGQERLGEAVDAYRRALELAPSDAAAHAGLAQALLGAGDYESGWAEYAWSVQTANSEWDGGPLDGKTILLTAEPGYGETIQFLRYTPLVAARGGRVVVMCPAPVVPLAATVPGVVAALPIEAPLPDFDVEARLASLPRLFSSRLEDLPSAECFQINPALADKWRRRLNRLPGRRIGLAWQGSKLHPGDRFRSISLARFAGLLLVPGYGFVSLQAGFGRDQIRQTGFGGRLLDPEEEIVRGSESFADFIETAGLLHAIDLVITVDTALAHLAASLGRPTWLLLPRPADWRWLTDRTDSPWYPAIRIFRQTVPGEWGGALGAVERALRAGEGP